MTEVEALKKKFKTVHALMPEKRRAEQFEILQAEILPLLQMQFRMKAEQELLRDVYNARVEALPTTLPSREEIEASIYASQEAVENAGRDSVHWQGLGAVYETHANFTEAAIAFFETVERDLYSTFASFNQWKADQYEALEKAHRLAHPTIF
ncbi:MAG: hypothetical protein GC136_02985 [Alphaproteobacteria bacterium]|nr:hypothetical protein [Alphaproteobacteria bacterium]